MSAYDWKANDVALSGQSMGQAIIVSPEDFLSILQRQQEPLVVETWTKIYVYKKNYQYVTSYKGLTFFTHSPTMLPIPANCEIIQPRATW